MPGQSSRTVAAALGVADSTFGDWVRGVSAPKRRREWASIERKLRQLRDQTTTQHAAVNGIPDPDWQRLFAAYLTRTGRTPEDIAKEYRATPARVERWRDRGEVPSDRTRAKLGALVGHRFEDAVYARALRAARQQFGRELPSPIDAATTAPRISEAIAAVRARVGTTNKGLAERCGITPSSRVENLSGMRRRPVHYSAESLADVLVRLARCVEALPTDALDAQSDVASALALLRGRSPEPKDAPVRLFVDWEAIERALVDGTSRISQFRCSNGESAAVTFVRFCIGYEQSRWTTAEAVRAFDMPEHRLRSWFRGRVFPEYATLPALQAAVERLDGKMVAPPAPAKQRARAPEVSERGVASDASVLPQEATGGFVTGIASIVHGLQQAYRAGWRPSLMQREHLATIARAVIDVGELTPDDLQTRSPEIASTPAPAIATLANMKRPGGRRS